MRVAVSQREIDLLNTPVAVLRQIAALHGIERASASQEELAQLLATRPRDELEVDSQGYLYAGKTSVSWIRFVPDELEIDPDDLASMRGVPLARNEVVDALGAISDIDLFSESSRPSEIGTRPQLIQARARPGAEDDLVLTVAYARELRQVIHNFQRQKVYEDEFFQAVLRQDQGLLEVRASAGVVKRSLTTWVAEFADQLKLRPVPVTISYKEFLALRDELSAILDVYRGRDATGTSVFGTRAFTRQEAVSEDLLDEQEFKDEIDDLEPVSLELLFDYAGYGEVRVYVSIQNGSVYIRNSVPDEVIEHVYRAVARIKGDG